MAYRSDLTAPKQIHVVEELFAGLIARWSVDLYARFEFTGSDPGRIIARNAEGVSEDELHELSVSPLIGELCRRSLQSGTPVVENGLHSDAGESRSAPLGISACVVAPVDHVAARANPTVVLFATRRAAEFSRSTVELLVQVANIVLSYAAEKEQSARQLRRLVIQLTEAEDRERSRIAALLHDDLQQTLAGIKVHVDMAARRMVGEQYASERLQTAVGLLEEAIERSRSLSRELSPPMLRLRGLVPALRALAEETEQTHALRVTVRAPDEIVPLSELARLMVFRAVQELLFNIVKHAGVDEATLVVNNVDGGLEVVVRDHGNGFDVDGVLDRDAPTGLGILSVRERFEAIGGSLVIDSTPGTGSVFTVYLPREATRVQGLMARGSPHEQANPNGRKTAVIVVDDHAVIRQGLVMLLNEEPDLEVVGEAENGARAIELARQLGPDVVVMDLSMPGVPGDEATAAILEEAPAIRVIGLSMHAEEEARARMLAAGADAYLPKAGPSSELIASIRRAARRRT